MTAQQPPPSVLVVDDDADTCRNLSDILSDLGYQVDTAPDGTAALALVQKHAYDVALLDYKMPGMTGLELYREIKKARAGTVAVIVSASKRRTMRHLRRFKRVGFFTHQNAWNIIGVYTLSAAFYWAWSGDPTLFVVPIGVLVFFMVWFRDRGRQRKRK